MSDDRALKQLIAIRRQALEGLRKDLSTLNQLTDDCARTLNLAQSEEDAGIEELRRRESGAERMAAMHMLAGRRYLDQLRRLKDKAQGALEQAETQRLRAQEAFDAAHAEIRTLERLTERRETARSREMQRRAYTLADDQEIVRKQGNHGSTHEAY